MVIQPRWATGGQLSPSLRGTITGHSGSVRAVACTGLDGRPVAVTGSDDATVRVWDLSTGQPVGQPLTGHTDPVRAVACTGLDGRPVAITGSEDATVRVWDLSTGQPVGQPLTGHTNSVCGGGLHRAGRATRSRSPPATMPRCGCGT